MSDYQLQFNGVGLASNSHGTHSDDQATNELQGLSIDANGNFPVYGDFLGYGIDYNVFSHNFAMTSATDDDFLNINNTQLTGSGTPFDPNFSMNLGPTNDISPMSYASTSFMPEMSQTTFPDGFGTSDSLLLAAQSMGLSAYSTPALMTPELLNSPSSSLHLMSPSPAYGYTPPTWLTTPHPSLAGPSTGEYTSLAFDSLSLSSSTGVPIGDLFVPSTTDSLSPPSSSKGCSCSESRPRTRKARSSTSKAISVCSKSFESSAHSRVPCTVRGCSGIFFDVRTRDRHVKSTHERAPDPEYICPGMCKPEGFSREDALIRHLVTRKPMSHCRIEAEKLGWSASVRTSIRRLRKVTPKA